MIVILENITSTGYLDVFVYQCDPEKNDLNDLNNPGHLISTIVKYSL